MSSQPARAPSASSVDVRKRRRFPFASHPKGWFVVAMSGDVPPGQIVELHYFGRDLVAYRGESGQVFVTDAYCPHLGAHLYHGGKIEGDTIRCPFHGWRFEGDGRCVEIPYCDKIPAKARLDALPVREQNGVIHVFHDPDGGAPWELPLLDEEAWTEGRLVCWRGLRTHVQEVFENTVDTAHIGPIHDGRGARVIGKPTMDRELMQLDIEFQAPGDIVGMPGTLNDVHLNVTLRGLGWVVVHTHVRNADVRARQRIYATPIDDETIDIRGVVHVRKTDDPAFTRELDEIFYKAYVEDFARDFPIWENKLYLDRPQLAKGDGQIGPYRRWCAQFYGAEETAETSEERSRSVSMGSQAAANPGAPDVPVSALGAARAVRAMFEPVEQRVVGTARRLFAAARRQLPWTEREAASAGGADGADSAASADGADSAASGAVAEGVAAPVVEGGGSDIRVSSADEYFETLEKRFVPAAAAGVDAVFQWELGGEGGGVFHAHVHNGQLDVRRGAHHRPDVALVLPAADYVRVVNGELDGMRAFTSGGGKVKGSIMAAMKMRSLFPARSP